MTKKISQLAAAASLTGAELLEVSQLSASVTITAATISAQASDNSFNDSGSGFVAAGFAIGDQVRITGFTGNVANNIVSARITGLTTAKMTIGGTDGDVIADDAAGESVTITKWVSRRATADDVAALAGTVESVVAGDGIAVDNTDPANPVVSGYTGELDGTPGTDDSHEGRRIAGVNAGATISQWQAVYMGSGGEWLLADATDDTTAPMRCLAVEAGTDGNPMAVATEGIVRNDAWNWTIGGTLYLSTTAGDLTQTAPSAAGEIVQQVGFAISANVIYLDVGDATIIEVAA